MIEGPKCFKTGILEEELWGIPYQLNVSVFSAWSDFLGLGWVFYFVFPFSVANIDDKYSW